MSTVKTAKSTTAATANAVKQIEEVVAVHKETIESVGKVGVDVASQSVDKAVSLTREQVEAAVAAGSAAFKGYEDILEFSRDNVEALVKSSTVVARGVQDLSKSFVSLAQTSIDESVAVGKALFGAKTLKEVIDLTTSSAKSNFDKLVAESTRFSQVSAKLAEEAVAPLTGCFDAAMQRFSRPVL